MSEPRKPTRIIVLFALGAFFGTAIAQAPQSDVVPNADPCRLAVSKFERSIGLVRQHQGNQAAAQLKERLLPAAVERELLHTKGYCGLAAYLKERKLDR